MPNVSVADHNCPRCDIPMNLRSRHAAHLHNGDSQVYVCASCGATYEIEKDADDETDSE